MSEDKPEEQSNIIYLGKPEPVGFNSKTRFLPVINNTVARPLPVTSTQGPVKPATRRGRDERCDAVQNRQKVLQAARQLFAERGIQAVTMSDIAEAAEVGKGTLYRRFAHKGLLCQALMDHNTQAFQTEVLSGFGEAGRQATPLGRLQLFLKRLMAFTEENAGLLRAAFEANIDKGSTEFYSQASYDWLRMTMAVLIKEAIASGECRPNLDIDYLADALLAPFQVGLYLHQREVRGFSTERIQAGFEQLMRGILL